MALLAYPYGLCETVGRGGVMTGHRRVLEEMGMNRIVPRTRRHRCRRVAGHALVVLRGTGSIRQRCLQGWVQPLELPPSKFPQSTTL